MAQQLIDIIVQYCNDPRPARVMEYDECVRRNLANPWVKQLHNLVEEHTVVPEDIRSHPKYTQTRVQRWLTYQDAFDYANSHLAGRSVCLCNLDIFLDETQTDWNHAVQLISTGNVICLARWEWSGEGTARKEPGLEKKAMATSQDAWIFRPPVNIPNCDFEIGLLGCDNAIAHRFRQSGLRPLNAPNLLRIFHLDNARGKSFQNFEEIHRQEAANRPTNRMPHNAGGWLVPDIDALSNLEQLSQVLHLNPLQKYDAACDLLNRYFSQARGK